MIRLSLIIATYNRAPSLIGALESVVRQDADPAAWECIVVNNNSQDDTEARFAAFAARYPGLRLRMVRETRQGLSHARNRGIAESKGTYIAIIDDDERINPGFVAAYIRFFDTHPAVAAAGGRIVPEYPAGRPAWMSRYVERPIANPLDLGPRERAFPAGCIPGGGNMALRRMTVEKYGMFDPALGRVGGRLIGGEESDLFERLARAGEVYWYVPDAVMWHIIPPEKLTDEYFNRLCYNVGVSQRLRAQLRRRYLRTLAVEAGKWIATLGLTLTMRPCRARKLLRMRYQITQGLLRG